MNYSIAYSRDSSSKAKPSEKTKIQPNKRTQQHTNKIQKHAEKPQQTTNEYETTQSTVQNQDRNITTYFKTA
jgi:hypothetical protein